MVRSFRRRLRAITSAAIESSAWVSAALAPGARPYPGRRTAVEPLERRLFAGGMVAMTPAGLALSAPAAAATVSAAGAGTTFDPSLFHDEDDDHKTRDLLDRLYRGGHKSPADDPLSDRRPARRRSCNPTPPRPAPAPAPAAAVPAAAVPAAAAPATATSPWA